MMDDAFDRAVQRERSIRAQRRCGPAWGGFLFHLRIYLWVNALLAAIWLFEVLTEGPHELWFLEVAFWWGVGLVAHGLAVRKWRPRKTTLPSQDADRNGGPGSDGREHDDPSDPRRA